MKRISENDIKRIRQEADIVDIVSHYVPLQKKGRNYRGVCPFHDDHDPSMQVNVDRQIFKCFVCGTGGNVFTFVQKIENVPFTQAIVKVAQLVNDPLDITLDDIKPVQSVNRAYYDCIQAFIMFTNYLLTSDIGAYCYDYLSKRKINDDIIKRFELGFAPESNRSINYFEAKGIDENVLMETGLVSIRNERKYTLFTNRLMIPIHDEYGNPVGFSARRLNDDIDESKYINTSETKIYHKGELIFNYHRAKEYARKNQRCILVEGAMDVLAFEKAEIHESLACLGTACTDEQVNLLKRLNVPIVVCYDPDQAGLAATYKFGKKALERDLSFSIVKNTTGKDPDEIFNAFGKNELALIVDRTISYPEFLLDYLPRIYNLDNYEDKKSFVDEMKYCVDRMCKDYERADYYARIKKMTGFDLNIVNKTSVVENKKSNKRNYNFIELPKSGRLLAEYGALSMMLYSKDACDRFKEEIGFFKDPVCEELSLYCMDMYRRNDQLDLDVLMAGIESDNVRDLLVTLMSSAFGFTSYNEAFFKDSLNKIKESSVKEQIDQINADIEQVQDPLLKVQLAAKKKDLILKRNEMLNRKEG